MMVVFQRLLLGISLIAIVSTLVLLGDLKNRRQALKPSASAPIPIAILQAVSTPVLDETAEGLLQALADRGYRPGERITVTRFNAEGNSETANTIALKMTDGSYKLLFSLATTSLQSLYRANRLRHIPHVFGAVADPSITGIGIGPLPATGKGKPAWMAGKGSLQPVAAIFRAARKINPSLKVVGVVWNNAEVNSEATVKLARKISAELGLTLVEATIEGTRDVPQAAESLLSRGAQAIWTGGDASVASAIRTLVASATKGGIPVFSNITGHALAGGLFDLGADYKEVGYAVGQMGADVLDGKDLSAMVIDNYMPERIMVNLQALAKLREKELWQFPPEFLAQAQTIIQPDGKKWVRSAVGAPLMPTVVADTNSATVNSVASNAGPSAVQLVAPSTSITNTNVTNNVPLASRTPAGKLWNIYVVNYNDTPAAHETTTGFFDGMTKAGYIEKVHYTAHVASANGDLATLALLIESAVKERPDLLFTVSTPTLQSALKICPSSLPIVFSYVGNPLILGAGKSYTEHLNSVTGISSVSAFEEMCETIARYFPQFKTVGTLYSTGEINSVYYRDEFQKAAEKYHIRLESGGVATVQDLAACADELCNRRIEGRKLDCLVQISDNLTGSGFTAIARAARNAGIPLFGFQSAQVKEGAIFCIGRDFHDGGMEGADKAIAILKGTSPGAIPFANIEKVRMTLNLQNATEVNLDIPPELAQKCDRVKATPKP